MIEIMTVCTGNVCRSPLAAHLLRARLADLDAHVHSAGTRGLIDSSMTEETVQLAVARGILPSDAATHRARWLTEQLLTSPDLILAMSREHRREIAELAPSRLRSTFTIREFARLSASLSDEQLMVAADAAGPDSGARLRAASVAIASMRGLVPPPADPAEDDVIDPFGRSWATYERAASQLDPAISAVERVARLALGVRSTVAD